jgi:hypothetical protein
MNKSRDFKTHVEVLEYCGNASAIKFSVHYDVFLGLDFSIGRDFSTHMISTGTTLSMHSNFLLYKFKTIMLNSLELKVEHIPFC